MNIFFDYQIFALQKYGGISRYFVELSRALYQFSPETSILSPFHTNLQNEKHRAAHPELYATMPLGSFFKSPEARLRATEWLTRFKCRNKKSVLHETYYSHRVRVRSPKVITVHDMIYELFGSGSHSEQAIISQKKVAIDEADAIIAVSENTRRELLNFYPQAEKKVHVIHHGVSELNASGVRDFVHAKPFILFVGNRGWYKNFKSLISVYAASSLIKEQFDIICCGGGPITTEEKGMLTSSGILNNVKFVSGDDDFVDSLYLAASVLVYISEHEGFGMPVLEAMRCGCPVLCSNTSSLPEVAGDAALLVDVKDHDAITRGLESILFDSTLRGTLKQKGMARAHMFTWERCAQETLKVYESVIGK